MANWGVAAKAGWALLFLHGAYGLVSGTLLAAAPLSIVTGGTGLPEGKTWEELREEEPWLEPFLEPFLRLWGVSWLGMSALAVAITVWPFRREERWAWWALWVYPLLQAYQASDFVRGDAADGAVGLWFHVAMALLGIVALALTAPTFFGRPQAPVQGAT